MNVIELGLELGLEPVAQAAQVSRLGINLFVGDLARFTQAHDAGHVQGAGPHAALVAAAIDNGRKLHPDLYARAGTQEQEWSLQQSSLLNDAHRTLKDPIKRTQYLLKLEGVELEEQSKSATEQARSSGEIKKQIVPPDLLEEVFELNMQLEELRTQKKMGEDDPALIEEIGRQKLELEEKHEALLRELEVNWRMWDGMIQRQQNGQPVSEEERRQERDKMVDLLNRRNYIRNLVRDVNEALESD